MGVGESSIGLALLHDWPQLNNEGAFRVAHDLTKNYFFFRFVFSKSSARLSLSRYVSLFSKQQRLVKERIHLERSETFFTAVSIAVSACPVASGS